MPALPFSLPPQSFHQVDKIKRQDRRLQLWALELFLSPCQNGRILVSECQIFLITLPFNAKVTFVIRCHSSFTTFHNSSLQLPTLFCSASAEQPFTNLFSLFIRSCFWGQTLWKRGEIQSSNAIPTNGFLTSYPTSDGIPFVDGSSTFDGNPTVGDKSTFDDKPVCDDNFFTKLTLAQPNCLTGLSRLCMFPLDTTRHQGQRHRSQWRCH